MKTMMTLAALLLGSTAALAGPFGLPDHQQDGYRDTGCDPALQVQVTDANGNYLYSNNRTCPGGLGGDVIAEDDEETPVDPEEEVASK